MTDQDLLALFHATQDEQAFEAMVVRHGPMVLRVCRNILDDPYAADDAFQSTFLVLVRRSHAIRDPQQLGAWLHGVATRVAIRSRVSARRSDSIEVTGLEVDTMAARDVSNGHDLGEIRPVLHAEILGLPAKLRRAIVLCYLEGKTYERAAQDLQLPLGTLKGRLSRGRELLRSRLARRGVTASALALLLVLTEQSPAVSEELLTSTLESARFQMITISRDIPSIPPPIRAGLNWQPPLLITLALIAILGASLSQLKADPRPPLPVVTAPPTPPTVDPSSAFEAVMSLEHCSDSP